MELILDGIKKSFGSKEVLKDVSYVFEEGKIYGLLGRNGAGKTTLFNCLSEEITADAGTAEMVSAVQKREVLTSDQVGYVLSTPILPEFLTGYEFVKFFMDVNENRPDKDLTADDWMDRVNLDKDDRNRLIKGYSHGMRNKLQMLGCFIASPPVVLLDEPLTSLDVVVALEIKKMLQQMKEDRILLFSTHILQLAVDLCDEIVILHDGGLERLDHEQLGSRELEAKVVEMLKDDGEEKD